MTDRKPSGARRPPAPTPGSLAEQSRSGIFRPAPARIHAGYWPDDSPESLASPLPLSPSAPPVPGACDRSAKNRQWALPGPPPHPCWIRSLGARHARLLWLAGLAPAATSDSPGPSRGPAPLFFLPSTQGLARGGDFGGGTTSGRSVTCEPSGHPEKSGCLQQQPMARGHKQVRPRPRRIGVSVWHVNSGDTPGTRISWNKAETRNL